MIHIGILAVQGAVAEHKRTVERTLKMLELKGDTVLIRSKKDLDGSDAIIIPGGESTTISKLIVKFGLSERLKDRVEQEDFPVMGTCAGCILLASEGDMEVQKTGTQLLRLFDYRIQRNAFGSQRESFEMSLAIEGIASDSEPFPGVFIRAPLILKTWGDCTPLCQMPDGSGIIAAQQNRMLALVFHPELTDDLRVHKYFIEAIE
jgi:5'-phosphate synthase pdxT subunit